jgi:ferritin-like metal-binding protein YciE
MSAETVKELLINELKDLYSAETQLTKALPKMAKAAMTRELKEGFTEHLEQTEGHLERLDEAFELLGVPAKAKLCKAMKGLVEEGAEAMSENDESAVRDAQLIGAAQRVEHYEMAAYGTVKALALSLGEKEVAALLNATLQEEGETDKKLTKVSLTVNRAALAEDDES